MLLPSSIWNSRTATRKSAGILNLIQSNNDYNLILDFFFLKKGRYNTLKLFGFLHAGCPGVPQQHPGEAEVPFRNSESGCRQHERQLHLPSWCSHRFPNVEHQVLQDVSTRPFISRFRCGFKACSQSSYLSTYYRCGVHTTEKAYYVILPLNLVRRGSVRQCIEEFLKVGVTPAHFDLI